LAYGHDFPVEIKFGAPRKIGFCFIRLQTNESTQPLLVPYLLFPKRGWLFSYKIEDLIKEASIRSNIAALIFFETLRVMVANKRLLGCPMRFIPWAVRTSCTPRVDDRDYYPLYDGYRHRLLADTECCGRIDLLMRLYEAGKKAGFPEQTWRKPIECLSCCSPSQGDEITRPLYFPSYPDEEDEFSISYPKSAMSE
jgi:hypothetical protein